MTRSLRLGTVVLVVASACEAAPEEYVGYGYDERCVDVADGIFCDEEASFKCVASEVVAEQECAGSEQPLCLAGYGCVTCQPLAFDCVGNDFHRCSKDGLALELQQRCEDLVCSSTGCGDPCAEAESSLSYLGCEYWPVFTRNSELDELFKPALVIGNPNLVDTVVTVTLGGEKIVTETIPRQSSKAIELEFDPRLKGHTEPLAPLDPSAPKTVLVEKAAYHVTTNSPVTVLQFNPLLFQTDKGDCAFDPDNPNTPQDESNDGSCNSYTNDASLLLPAHTLRSDYIVVTRGTAKIRSANEPSLNAYSGFVTIVGVKDEPVDVVVTVSAFTEPSTDGLVPALSPGEQFTIRLGAGDVFQLLSAEGPLTCPVEEAVCAEDGNGNAIKMSCDLGGDYDLSGTTIKATGPVEVIVGHDCAQVPYDRVACDHLEETLFPVETWGKEVVVTRPRPLSNEKSVLQVVSGADDNRVEFEPAVIEPIRLDLGEVHEMEVSEHVLVRGTKPLAVAQYLEGQGQTDRNGDPSMSFAIPVDQYRPRYDFLTPDTYRKTYVNIVSRRGASVTFDGRLVESFTPLGDTEFQVAVAAVLNDGAHVIESSTGSLLGVILYGYAPYTSYMLPAGLDLVPISPTPL
jgi:hypothetical protein